MTRREALTATRAMIQDGIFPGDLTGPEMGFPNTSAAMLYYAFSGSLDAAHELHEAVLPRWSPDICRTFLEKRWVVSLARVVRRSGDDLIDGEEWDDIEGVVEAVSDSPARAWLLAILEALIAEEGDA